MSKKLDLNKEKDRIQKYFIDFFGEKYRVLIKAYFDKCYFLPLYTKKQIDEYISSHYTINEINTLHNSDELLIDYKNMFNIEEMNDLNIESKKNLQEKLEFALLLLTLGKNYSDETGITNDFCGDLINNNYDTDKMNLKSLKGYGKYFASDILSSLELIKDKFPDVYTSFKKSYELESNSDIESIFYLSNINFALNNLKKLLEVDLVSKNEIKKIIDYILEFVTINYDFANEPSTTLILENKNIYLYNPANKNMPNQTHVIDDLVRMIFYNETDIVPTEKEYVVEYFVNLISSAFAVNINNLMLGDNYILFDENEFNSELVFCSINPILIDINKIINAAGEVLTQNLFLIAEHINQGEIVSLDTYDKLFNYLFGTDIVDYIYQNLLIDVNYATSILDIDYICESIRKKVSNVR